MYLYQIPKSQIPKSQWCLPSTSFYHQQAFDGATHLCQCLICLTLLNIYFNTFGFNVAGTARSFFFMQTMAQPNCVQVWLFKIFVEHVLLLVCILLERPSRFFMLSMAQHNCVQDCCSNCFENCVYCWFGCCWNEQAVFYVIDGATTLCPSLLFKTVLEAVFTFGVDVAGTTRPFLCNRWLDPPQQPRVGAPPTIPNQQFTFNQKSKPKNTKKSQKKTKIPKNIKNTKKCKNAKIPKIPKIPKNEIATM